MHKQLSALLSGLVFGLGLVLSGMTQPAKVLGFLDVTGAWDASLGLVMVGAIGVYSPLYHLLFARRLGPAISTAPERVDGRLLLGAAIFGVGWGMGGFCPGPAITALASGAWPALIFVGAMLSGMLLFSLAFPEASRGIASVPPPSQ